MDRAARTRARIVRPRAAATTSEYWHFCLNHVREYNQSYNFFSGHERRRGRALPEGRADRPSPDLEDGRQRPRQEGKQTARPISTAPPIRSACSPSSTAAAAGGRVRARAPSPRPRPARSCNAERKALQVMGLGADATLETVKAKYKALVKAAPSRRQWRRPLHRGSPDRNHQGL